jgi:hypothetical protein
LMKPTKIVSENPGGFLSITGRIRRHVSNDGRH